MPASECQCQTESVCAAYLDCSLHRRYASYKGKLALTNAEICSWETFLFHAVATNLPGRMIPNFKKLLTS